MTAAVQRSLMPDHQGSIIAMADASGAPAGINRYDEWGVPGAANSGRFQYTGQAWIPELGMYYYKARIYSPTLGRFLQTDPIGYKDHVNLYAYVGNDPVNRVDPDGEDSACFYGPSQCNNIGPFNVLPNLRVVADFLFGDIINAFNDPSGQNIAIAVVSVTPFGKLSKAGKVYRLATAKGTRLAQRALSDARKAADAGFRRGEGKALFGAGTGKPLDQSDRLADQYGGKPSDWQKVTSEEIARGSDGTSLQRHAYRNVETGKVVEAKDKWQGVVR